METIGKRIKAVRDNLDISQKAFGARIGVSQTTLTALENDKNSPSLDTFNKLVEEFHIDAEWLRTGKGQMKPGPKEQEPLVVSKSELSESERMAYWKQLAEERGRLLEQAQEREQRLWKQIDSFPLGNADSAEHQANRAKMRAEAA